MVVDCEDSSVSGQEQSSIAKKKTNVFNDKSKDLNNIDTKVGLTSFNKFQASFSTLEYTRNRLGIYKPWYKK